MYKYRISFKSTYKTTRRRTTEDYNIDAYRY
jgi:hypothetical protein